MRTSTLAVGFLLSAHLLILGDRKPSVTPGPVEGQTKRSATIAAKPAPPETAPPAPAGDVILRAMKDELDRSRRLSITSLDDPYYIEYEIDDVHSFNVSASLGGLLNTSQNRLRIPRVRVRVGSYAFDNTNYVFSDFFGGARYHSDRLSLDDNYNALRYDLWLATDRAYKGAVEAIARKRASLKNITQSDELPDLWKAPRTEKVLPVSRVNVDAAGWTSKVREWSAVFKRYPEVFGSQVSFDAAQSTHHMHNSEGTTLRWPDMLFYVSARAGGQASDGMAIRDSVFLQGSELSSLPGDAEIAKAITQVAGNIKALTAAPAGETYNGPVLFEGIAAPQIFGEVFGAQLTLPRRPVGEPGRNLPFTPSEFEGRIGSRVLPEFLDVTDDPSAKKWKNVALFGSFEVDEEGVPAKPLKIVDKGRLEQLLLTRQPVKGFTGSNGRARLPGSFGAKVATYSNLIVQPTESVKESELKGKLIELIKQRNKPYGMLIRKMDFPSTASLGELRQIAARGAQGGRPVSSPILAYRVYPDGREELVRGLRLRAFTVRTFRDIVAVSEEQYVFHVMNNMMPFALVGGATFVAPQSIIAPSLLFDEVELERPQENLPKLPLVPPPPLSASR